jgi:Co/Zn/Cd efflux system component
MLYGCERALQEHHSGVLVVGEGGLPVAGVVAALANRCHHQLRSVRLAADVVVAVLVVVAAVLRSIMQPPVVFSTCCSVTSMLVTNE